MKKTFTLLFALSLATMANAQTKITHSSSDNIWTGGSATCSAAGVPYINHFMRRFDLNDFPELVDTVWYVGVEYGVESTSKGDYDVLLYIYDLSGPFQFANMSVDEWVVSAVYPDSSNYVKFEPFTTGYALPTDTLVVDLYTPTPDSATFYPGSNPLFESDSSYISANTCAIYEPSSFGSIGFPNCHIVLHLYGNQKPTAALASASTFRDNDLAFVHDDFIGSLIDPDADDTISAIRVLGLPTNGTLKLSGVDVVVNDVIASTLFDSLVYTPDPGYSGSDSYDIKVKDTYHWSNNQSSMSISIIDWATSIDENTIGLEVYPNPSTDVIKITANDEIAAIKLMDAKGNTIQTYGANTNEIDLLNLADGIYYIEVTTATDAIIEKIIKQ